MLKEIKKKNSQTCIEMAKEYIQKQNYELAEKFLRKSKKLFPLSEADVLLEELRRIQQQANLIQKVLNGENYYTIFDVKTTATKYEIAQARLKLYPLLHPEKNSPPELKTIFFVLEEAFHTLSDPKKRQTYDQTLKKPSSTSNDDSQGSSEINKEESYTCVEKAEECIQNQNYKLAEKFLLKSKKLFPLSEADELLKELRRIQQQANLIQKVLNGENYYTIFDVKTTATKNELEEARLKLYPLLHPEKNSPPELKTIYFVLEEAFHTLSDPKKRQTYDQTLKKPSSTSNDDSQGSTGTTYSFSMLKEINKDESYTCIEKAEECIQKQNYELAEKFLLKSKKLFPLSEADALLEKLRRIQQQANLIQKVKISKNHYEMLDIKETATVPEIRKAFKKLALLIHPDKNVSPDSGKIFAEVCNAVNTLCNNKTRRIYDERLLKH